MKTLIAVSLVIALVLLASSALGQVTPDPGWSSQPPVIKNTLLAVAVAEANTIVAVGNGGTILRSTDGGGNWTTAASPALSWLNAVSFSDPRTGAAVGGSGAILRTEDGGATWIQQSSGTTADLCSVSFADARIGIAVGTDRFCGG